MIKNSLLIGVLIILWFRSFSQTCTINIVQNDTTICSGNPLRFNITLSTNGNPCNTYGLSNELQNGLIGWYPFCGNTNDIGPQRNNGIATGPLTYSIDRYNNSNTAIKFTGNGESVRTNKIERNAVNSFSYVVWVNTSNTVTLPAETINPRSGFSIDLSSPCVIHATHGFNWNLDNQHTGAGLNIAKNGVFVLEHADAIVATPLSWSGNLDGWHSVALVYDNHLPKLYVDGSFVKDGLVTPYTVHPSAGCDSFFFYQQYRYITTGFGKGFNPSGATVPSNNFKGSIDDIKIYGRALTPAEIKELFEKDKYEVLWNTGDTTTIINVIPRQTTKYWVRVTNGNLTCSDTVTVSTIPTTTSVNITSSSTSIFRGASVIFTATPLNFLPPINYQWYKNKLPVGTNTAVYTDNTINNKDSIWVSATGNNSCGVSNTVLSNKINMTVNSNSTCTGSLGDPMVNVTFGAGPNPGPQLPAGITNMQYLTILCPNDGQYTIANSTSNCWGGNWHTITDHTGNTNGYFMLVNASYQPSDFYVQTVNGLCNGTTYEFSAWILNMIKNLNDRGILPNITFSIEKTDGTVLQSYNSGNIPLANPALWRKYGFYFTTPPGVSSVVIRMRNNAPGGGGNDLALDDITFRPAGPLTTIGIQGIPGDSISVCNSSLTLFSTVENCYLTNEYQWQLSVNNGNWTDIPGANKSTYITPINPQGNYKYRLSVAQTGNIGIASCRVYSNRVIVLLSADNPVVLNIPVTNCNGLSYTLPWGSIADTSGIYRDTLLSKSGCDSLIRIIELVIQKVSESNSSISVCAGQNYKLPWGTLANTTGIYRDTLRYLSGCDSLIRIINVEIKPVIVSIGSGFICSGNNFRLPWGAVVNSPAVYRDTIKYTSGCDSLIRVFDLREQTIIVNNDLIYVCEGQSYTLPWGTVVNTSGIYRDTLRYLSGCDSLIRIINVEIKPVIVSIGSGFICSGNNFRLPWGTVVYSPAVYRDTIKYSIGCDSLIRTFDLREQIPISNNDFAYICEGQSYTLPWGINVNTTNIYRDTIRYVSGCDSLIRTINLTVQNVVLSNIHQSICAGQSYTLPSGLVVNVAGNYVDTVRSRLSGCDSLITTLTLDTDLKPVMTLSKSNDINCSLGVATLNASGGNSYLWSPTETLDNPKSKNPIASPAVTTVYHVKVTSPNGCIAEDSIEVKVSSSPLDKQFDLPNAFTPNKDGLNDCFGIRKWGSVTKLNFSVYDRWGSLLFHTKDPSECWKGIYKGQELPSGAYVYSASANTICGLVYRKGIVILVR